MGTVLHLISKRLQRGLVEGMTIGFALITHQHSDPTSRYVPIGAVLMSKQVEDGIRSGSGFWQHGHTYQVRIYSPSESQT